MPGLPKGAYPVVFGQGLDTKTGKQRTQKLLALENAYFSKGGELAKRWGFNNLGAPSALGTGDSFLNFDNDLAVIAGGGIKSYSPSALAWVDKGNLLTAGVKTAPLAQISTDLTAPDAATLNGVTVHAYLSGNTVYTTVVDEVTGAALVQNKLIASGCKSVRCVAYSGRLYIFFGPVAGSTLSYVSLSPNTPTAFSAVQASVTDLSSSGAFAVAATTNFLCVAYDSSGTTGVTVADALPLASTPGIPSQTTLVTGITGRFGVSVSAIDITVDATGRIFVAGTTVTGVRVCGLSVQAYTFRPPFSPPIYLAALWADVTVDTRALGVVKQITIAPADAAGNQIDVYYEVALSTKTTEQAIQRSSITTSSGTASLPSVFLRSVGLASRAFFVGAPSTRSTVAGAYVAVTYDSTIQPTYFLASRTGAIVARFSAGKAGGLSPAGSLPSFVLTGATTFVSGLGVRGGVSAIAKTGTSFVRGVERVVLNFDQRYRNAQLGRNAHVGGGTLKIFDGINTVEQGFRVFPEAPSVQAAEWQLKLVTKDVPGTTPSVFQAVAPADVASGSNSTLKSGAQVRPGSYFVIWATGSAGTNDASFWYIWFAVDGAGTDPAPYSVSSNSTKVSLLSTDDQKAVHVKLAQALNLSGFPFTAAVQPSGGVNIANKQASQAASPGTLAITVPGPLSDNHLAISTYIPGVAGTVGAAGVTVPWTRVVTPSGTYLRSGQSFVMESGYQNGTTIKSNPRVCFYFVRTDATDQYAIPTIAGTVDTAPINILSTDTPSQVGTKVATAIDTYRYLSTQLWTKQTFSASPYVDLASVADSGNSVRVTADPVNIDAGGAVEDGTRLYYNVYAWTDAQGQKHRSAPSLPTTSVSYTGGNGNALVTAAPLRLTDKTNVQIEFYRTTAGVPTAQKIGVVANDPTVDSVVFYDAIRDTDLAFGEFLYTTGGVLPNIAPPPAQVVHNHRSRLVLGAIDVPNTIWYSKNFVDGNAVAFSDLFTLRLDDVGGDVTALATLDDKLIIFKAGRIYFVAGDGPNDLGQQNTFTPPQVIAADAGCISPESIVFTPRGLMFQSAKGIYLLDRNMQLSYLGAPVEDLVVGTITGAVLMPNATRVQFTFSSGKAIYYDYYFDQWGTATNHDAQAAKIFDGTFVMMKPADGSVWQETPGSFSDAGLAYAMKVQTPWIKPAGLQGFFRLRKFSFLGTYVAGHQMQVDVAYDYSEASTSYLFNAEGLYAGSIYGTGTPYGTGIYGGYTTEVYQFSVQPAQQKCESVRFTFTDTPGAGTLGNSYVIADLNLEIAVKDGSYRFPGTQRTG